MKANYYLFILLQVIYLTNCDELWKVNKLTNTNFTNLRQLAKIAKITQNTQNISPSGDVNPVRFTRSFGKPQTRRSRIGELWNEVTKNEVEAANNTVSDVNEKINGSNQHHLADTDSTASVSYPGKRESAGKRKQATKLSMPAKPVIMESTPKPTKYHYYPHNQHIYLLPECAIQQVCNAVYVRLNYTQPLCACPSRKEPCSASLNTDDMHTTELVTASTGKVLTLVKTCEPVAEMRICRAPRDWSLLALQNVRTGKSHYLVICRCSQKGRLEGPMSHDQPAYASVPGIRVYGMMCVRDSYRISRPLRYKRSLRSYKPEFPWDKLKKFQASIKW